MLYAGPGQIIEKLHPTTFGMLWPDYPHAIVLHTTETRGLPAYPYPPKITIDPITRKVWQHFSLIMRDGALRGSRVVLADTGVQTVMNEKAINVEIIAYSDHNVAQRVGGLWVGNFTDEQYEFIAQVVAYLRKVCKVGAGLRAQPVNGSWRYGLWAPTRGRAHDWEMLDGLTAHGWVFGQTHWDTGILDLRRIHSRAQEILTPPVIPPKNPKGVPLMDAKTLTKNSTAADITRICATGFIGGGDAAAKWWIALLDRPEDPQWERFWQQVFIGAVTS